METIEQRIAIAKACGWKQVSRTQQEGLFDDVRGISPTGTNHEHVPNYPRDLNAMHEAEKELFSQVGWKVNQYVEILNNLATGWMWRATAAQRAEAFLKTLGLWEVNILANAAMTDDETEWCWMCHGWGVLRESNIKAGPTCSVCDGTGRIRTNAPTAKGEAQTPAE